MRTETITIYSYSELSEEAKATAYKAWEPDYAFEADNRRTLEAFCTAFGIEVTEYLYDAYHYVFYWDADPEIKEIRKPELGGYIRHCLSLFEPTGFLFGRRDPRPGQTTDRRQGFRQRHRGVFRGVFLGVLSGRRIYAKPRIFRGLRGK